ncbi:MAG: hypothetical protein ABSE99_00200 [Terracidiphilus sp.]
MKRWHYIVLLGLLVFGSVYVYLHRQQLGLVGPRSYVTSDAASSDQTGPEARPAHINWQMADRSSDGFKVEMPSDIKEIQVPAYNESNGAEPVNMIFSNPDGGTSFAVAWADNPPVMRVNNRAPDRTLDMARDGALARTQTTLISESRSNPAGFPARDFVARNVGGGILDSRLIYAGEHLYMLIATFPSMSARREQDVTRFFNSFTPNQSPSIPETLPAAPAPAPARHD